MNIIQMPDWVLDAAKIAACAAGLALLVMVLQLAFVGLAVVKAFNK